MAEHEGELSFEPNEIITNSKFIYTKIKIFGNNNTVKWQYNINFKLLTILVHASVEPGWLEGTLRGKTGLIPENYVEELP